jgi:pimeloyl-ACP methyl ester carboxylesterase
MISANVSCRCRRLLSGLLALTVIVTACTTGRSGNGPPTPGTTHGTSAPSSSGGVSRPIQFTDCSSLLGLSAANIPNGRTGRLEFGCGRVPVPLDYGQPTGQMIDIGLIRVHDSGQTQRIGSLIMDPGGPGDSGILFAIQFAGSVSDDLLQHFDLIGFDPRGVGVSAPVRCTTDAQEDALLALSVDVRAQAGLAAAKQANAAVSAQCNAKYGKTLEHFNTVETAQDMDLIRQGLGDTKINYLGFSYGTELGAVYAHLYPAHIRVMALDGAVDPGVSGDAIRFNELQVAGFESAFDQFAADCAKRRACAALGNARAAVQALRQEADRSPIRSSVPGDRRRATGGIVLYAVLQALYSQSEWPSLGTALLQAQHGDAKGLFELVDDYSQRSSNGEFSNLLDVYGVVTCNDQRTDPSDAQVQATARIWARKYPLFGVWFAASLVQCQSWQSRRHPVPAETAVGSPPILVIGNLHDPATPYQGAVNLARSLTTGVLLSWDGEGHTSYGSSACVDQKVNAYLINRTAPSSSTTCPR